jgi:hypothetical protein
MAVQKIFPQQIDYTYRIVSSNTTFLDSDGIILANTTSSITLTLPDAAASNGSFFTVKNINTGNVVILTSGTDLIDGQSNVVIQHQYTAASVISLGSVGWILV